MRKNSVVQPLVLGILIGSVLGSCSMLTRAAETPALQKTVTWNDVLDRTLASHPDMLEAQAEIDVAKAGLKASQATWYPQISANALRGISSSEEKGLNNRTQTSENDIENYNLEIQQRLYNKPFSIAVEQSRMRVEKAQATFAAQQADTTLAWFSTYLDIHLQQSQLKAVTAEEQLQAWHVEGTQLAYDKGTKSLKDLQLRQAELARQQTAKTAQEQQIELLKWEMRLLAGLAPEEDLPSLANHCTELAPNSHLLDLIRNRESENNSKIRAAELEVGIAALEIKRRQGEHMPNINLVARTGQSQSDTPATLGRDIQQTIAAVQLQIPIFNGMGTLAATDNATALWTAASAQQLRAYKQTSLQIQQNSKKIQSAQQQLASLKILEQAVQTSLNAAEEGLKLGLNSEENVWIEQVNVAKAEAETCNKLVEMWKAQAAVLSLQAPATEILD